MENKKSSKKEKVFRDLIYYTVIAVIYMLIEYIIHTLIFGYYERNNTVYVPTANARLVIMFVICAFMTVIVGLLQKNDKLEMQLYPLYIILFFMIIVIPEGITMGAITMRRNWFNILETILPISIGEGIYYYIKMKKLIRN